MAGTSASRRGTPGAASVDRCRKALALGECGRPTVGPGRPCIFHLDDKTLEQEEEFTAGLRREIERLTGDSGVGALDFSQFVFPSKRGVFRFNEITNIFRKPVIFSYARFRGGADFSNCTFAGEVNFVRATFGGWEEFLGAADFTACTFEALARFGATRFAGGSESNPGAEFRRATFRAEASFIESVFDAWASFSGIRFESNVWFSRAHFAGGAIFSRSRFIGTAEFRETAFAEADFTGVVFSGAAGFVETKFPAQATPVENSVLLVKGIFLRDVQFAQPGKVQFRGSPSAPIDLCAVSFLSTDVEGVVFVDEKWGRRHAGRAARSAVMDEALIEPSERYLDHPLEQSFPTYEKVKQLYRRLRKNYEAAGRYAEAGDFFVGEMEMRRLDVAPRNAFARRVWRNVSFIALYKHLSLYGESHRRLVAWSVALIGAFTVLRALLPPGTGVAPPAVTACLVDSVAAFFQLPRGDSALDLFERILSAPLIGLLLVSLKRNFERK